MKRVSIVVPVYNEEGNIRPFYQAICETMSRLPYDWELLFVDDGSEDGSWQILEKLAQKDSRVQPMQLSRNMGHQLALTCGMDHAEGDAVITMDGDMQHPPSLIPTLTERWEQGYDIVQTIRKETMDASLFKRISSRAYYRLLNCLSDVPISEGGSDFRLMDRKALQAFRHHREHVRFIRGMIGALGFRRTQVDFIAPPRHTGTSKFSLKKMLHLAIDGVIACSTLPLRFGLYIGGFCALVGIAIFVHALIEKYVFQDAVLGWTSILGSVVFFGGMQLVALGLIGVYIGHIFEEVKHRPLYIVSRVKPREKDERDRPEESRELH